MTTNLIRTFVGSHPGLMEGLSKYFYWPDLQTGVCLLILVCFMMGLESSKELIHDIPVLDLCLYQLHSERH